MKNPLSGLVGAITVGDDDLQFDAEDTSEDLLTDVELARQQWVNAKAFFDHVTDPDLVDMAIYSIEAAEKRYMYLLKMARNQGVSLTSAAH